MGRARVVVVGEGMLELAPRAQGGWQLGHGGDALNTAIHMARLGSDVALGSAIGIDGFSERLHAAWTAEGIDCSILLRDPTREAGLYAIEVDDAGERSFAYWREQSAARSMFELADSDRLIETAERSQLLYFSLITLAILAPASREILFDIARKVRSEGGKVAFDGNYRPRLWPSAAAAIAARDAAIGVADIGLPTFDDEAALSGERSADQVAAHWKSLGCREVMVKMGAAGCRLPDGTKCAPAAILDPVDTSGAGDAFNAAYLHSRLHGHSIAEAASSGHELAGWTIARFGAIPTQDDAAPY